MDHSTTFARNGFLEEACNLEFSRYIRQVTLTKYILWNVTKRMDRKEWASTLTRNHGGSHQGCSILWADEYWVVSHSKEHLVHMMWELI